MKFLVYMCATFWLLFSQIGCGTISRESSVIESKNNVDQDALDITSVLVADYFDRIDEGRERRIAELVLDPSDPFSNGTLEDEKDLLRNRPYLPVCPRVLGTDPPMEFILSLYDERRIVLHPSLFTPWPDGIADPKRSSIFEQHLALGLIYPPILLDISSISKTAPGVAFIEFSEYCGPNHAILYLFKVEFSGDRWIITSREVIAVS